MTCEELKDLYELYALGLLEGEERTEMDAHLARGCETCRKGFNIALALNSLVLSLADQKSPPARLKRRVLASVGVERSSAWSWIGILAAASMLVVAVWFSLQERQRSTELADARQMLLQVSAERDSMQQAFRFLNDPETRPASFGKGQTVPPRGNVFVNRNSGVLLIASNLPALGAGKAYEMWVIPKGAGAVPRPAGLFQSNSQGAAFHILSGPMDTETLGTVAVTVEPEQGSSAPTSAIVIAAGF